MEWLDYRQLPPLTGGYSELFFDYVYDYDEVKAYYPANFRENGAYEGVFKAVERRQLDRTTLTSVLTEQNAPLNPSPRTLENIDLLARPSTFAVVTGQQVGLFGGPLYTIYKTITAMKLAEKLKLRFPKKDFVPVFWLEGEDHDFAEMNHTSVLDSENGIVRLEYLPDGTMPERNVGAVGEMVFDNTILQAVEKLANSLQKTEFTASVVASLKECYSPGRSFTDGFSRWMNRLFEGHGIIFCSPSHPRLKRLLSPLFIKELEEFPKNSQMVITRSAELEQRYHAQIKAKSINLFMFYKGGRYLIEPRETDFSLKGTRAFFQKDELMAIARDTPELLSPNVILRPLCQDTLLPTVSYVGGPSEIAYFAQLQPVYDDLALPEPVVYPRASVSLIQGSLVRAMEKYGLELTEFLGDISKVTQKVVEQISEIKLDVLFSNVSRNVHDALNEAKFGLNEIDPTLLGALDTVSSKIDVNIGVLKDKSIAAQKRRNETAVRQIEKAAAGLLPGGSLQERELNVVYYLNRYGPDLVKWLMEHVDITGYKHQVLTP